MDILSKGVITYRTDLDGTVVCKSDGYSISFNQNMTDWKLVSVEENQTYYFTSNYIFNAGATITIASGSATGTIKWTSANIWNNTGDKAELYNNDGLLVSNK